MSSPLPTRPGTSATSATLRRVPVPQFNGADRSYPLRSDFPADYFYEVPDGARRWITSLDEDGRGLVQTSTDALRGRKLFLWGAERAGRRWQRWLTEPGTGGYAEIQAGLARTQLEHVALDGGGEFSWLEAYGPLAADPAAVHGDDWGAARGEVAARLEAALPRADVEAALRRLAAVRRRANRRSRSPPAPAGARSRSHGPASTCPAPRSTRPPWARSSSRG